MPTFNDPLASKNPSSTAPWQTLSEQASLAKKRNLTDYFNADPNRHHKLSYSAAGINANLSRHFLDPDILKHLLALANAMALPSAITSLQQGECLNFTEQRAALHTALRTPCPETEQQQLAIECRHKMRRICQALMSGEWRGHNGKAITDIVSIGIGGSDLGPRMASEALTPFHNNQLKVHFVTNIDPCDIEATLRPLNPDSTLFIVISKSWATLETLTNAEAAKRWFCGLSQQNNISQHFIAVSARPDRCESFGIPNQRVLPTWDWVGGRFSLWSAVGLPIALATSFETFEALLKGAHEMDQHFFNTPIADNLAVILALLEVWYVNFWGCYNVAVLPYDHSLRLLPNHLQQLTMESNGKSVDRSGKPLNYASAPVLWGSAGTIGQHSFHQLLHQGTQLIPVDFILPLSSHSANKTQHVHMTANCLAQAQTLMDGQSADKAAADLISAGYGHKDAEQLAQHKAIPANRPSTIISFNKLSPKNLGALIALYEHKTYSASIIWNINAFDQWGVELGKTAYAEIHKDIQCGRANQSRNPATQAAIKELLNSA